MKSHRILMKHYMVSTNQNQTHLFIDVVGLLKKSEQQSYKILTIVCRLFMNSQIFTMTTTKLMRGWEEKKWNVEKMMTNTIWVPIFAFCVFVYYIDVMLFLSAFRFFFLFSTLIIIIFFVRCSLHCLNRRINCERIFT